MPYSVQTLRAILHVFLMVLVCALTAGEVEVDVGFASGRIGEVLDELVSWVHHHLWLR